MLETKHKFWVSGFWVKFPWCNWHHLNCMVLNSLAAEETFSMGGQTDRSRSERWWGNILPTISQLLFNESQSGRTESHAIPWNCCKWANDCVPGCHTCSDLLFFGLIISFFVVSFYIHPFRIYNHHLIRLEDSFTPVINFSNNHQCTRCCNVLYCESRC